MRQNGSKKTPVFHKKQRKKSGTVIFGGETHRHDALGDLALIHSTLELANPKQHAREKRAFNSSAGVGDGFLPRKPAQAGSDSVALTKLSFAKKEFAVDEAKVDAERNGDDSGGAATTSTTTLAPSRMRDGELGAADSSWKWYTAGDVLECYLGSGSWFFSSLLFIGAILLLCAWLLMAR